MINIWLLNWSRCLHRCLAFPGCHLQEASCREGRQDRGREFVTYLIFWLWATYFIIPFNPKKLFVGDPLSHFKDINPKIQTWKIMWACKCIAGPNQRIRKCQLHCGNPAGPHTKQHLLNCSKTVLSACTKAVPCHWQHNVFPLLYLDRLIFHHWPSAFSYTIKYLPLTISLSVSPLSKGIFDATPENLKGLMHNLHTNSIPVISQFLTLHCIFLNLRSITVLIIRKISLISCSGACL